jgi:hypothetical protein
MAGKSGGSVLELPDIAYERRTLRTTINGEPFAADGWVNGPGCPGRIKAEYARRRSAFVDSADTGEGAYYDFLVDALRIVFELPAAQYDQADLIAGETARAEHVLTAFKWMKDLSADAEDDADPEAQGGETPSTTPSSSPTSVVPTRPRRTAAAG